VATHIVCHGVIVPGRAQYLVIQLALDLQLGIINIYPQNFSRLRARLWQTIKNHPLPNANWVLARDFNIIESLDDKLGRSDTTNHCHNEVQRWNEQLVHLQLQDTYHLDEFRNLI
jgi:hypothetical protein